MLRSSPGHELDSRPSLTHVQLTHDAMQHAPALQMLECHRPHTYLSPFPPPRQDAGAIKAAIMRQFAAEESHGLRATDLTQEDIRFTVQNTFGYRISDSSNETDTPMLASCYIS